MEQAHLSPERRVFWPVVLSPCGIAAAVSVRRLIALADPSVSGISLLVALDAQFAAHAGLTLGHALAGLVLALLIPVQLSARIRGGLPALHRWVRRTLVIVGLGVALTGYAMVSTPVEGPARSHRDCLLRHRVAGVLADRVGVHTERGRHASP